MSFVSNHYCSPSYYKTTFMHLTILFTQYICFYSVYSFNSLLFDRKHNATETDFMKSVCSRDMVLQWIHSSKDEKWKSDLIGCPGQHKNFPLDTTYSAVCAV